MYAAPVMQQAMSGPRFLSPRFWPTWLLLGCMRLGAMLPLPALVILGSAVGECIRLLAFERRRVARTNLLLAFPGAVVPMVRM